MNSVHSNFCLDCGADMSGLPLEGHDADAYFNRGCAYGNLGEYPKAIADYDDAIRLNPDFATAYYNRGVAYDELGEKQEAEANFSKAKELGYESW